MHLFRDIILPILVATGYLTSVFFAASALVPPNVALQLAAGVMFLALLALFWLRRIGMDDWGAPAGTLYLFPLIIAACGIGTWVVRLLGLGA